MVSRDSLWLRYISFFLNSPYPYILNILKPSDVLKQVGPSAESILRLLNTLRTRVTGRWLQGYQTNILLVEQPIKSLPLVLSSRLIKKSRLSVILIYSVGGLKFIYLKSKH